MYTNCKCLSHRFLIEQTEVKTPSACQPGAQTCLDWTHHYDNDRPSADGFLNFLNKMKWIRFPYWNCFLSRFLQMKYSQPKKGKLPTISNLTALIHLRIIFWNQHKNGIHIIIFIIFYQYFIVSCNVVIDSLCARAELNFVLRVQISPSRLLNSLFIWKLNIFQWEIPCHNNNSLA